MTRLPILEPGQMNAAQKAVHDKILNGPRGRSIAIFNLIANSARMADVTQEVGVYLRYGSKLTDRVREFATLIAAANSKADYEWRAHSPLAIKAGVPEGVLDAVGRGRRPDFDNDEDRLVFDYVSAVLRREGLEDALFEEARAHFGDEQLVDLTGLAGYYTMLSTFMRAFELMPEPEEPRAPWRNAG